MAFKKLIPTIALLALSSAAIADENYSNLNVGPTLFAFSGKEETVNGSKEDKGVCCGVRAELEYAKTNVFYAGLFGVYAPGATTTTHTLPSLEGEPSATMKVAAYLWQAEARMGKHFSVAKKSSIVPYLAGGIYNVDSSITHGISYTDTEAKYSSQMRWMYIATGVSGSYSVNDTLDLALGAKLMRHLSSKNKLVQGDQEATIELDSKWGFEVNLPVKIRAGKTSIWNFQVEPFFLKIDTAKAVNVYGARMSIQRGF